MSEYRFDLKMFWRKNKEAGTLAELKKRFGTLVPEESVSIAFLGINNSIVDALVDFIFLLIEEENSEKFRILTSKAIQIATQHKAIVVANAGGLIQLAAGPRIGDTDSAKDTALLAGDFSQLLGDAGRVVHGRTLAHVGIVGTESRRNWGFFPLEIGQILQALLNATPGVAVDLGAVRTHR